mmetsp:Transcript_9917/g.22919  ORF Transcript_9917/g.22919 Transcript_9917/m.22919 type:complete len:192 (-) Transcript_9917:128-703(-)
MTLQYQMALSGSYYAPLFDPPDDGTALLTALTKCDRDSWCSGLRDDNLTMTRESWHDGTYSHAWGASPLAGVAWGVMGVQQTEAAFAAFTVRPKLATLAHASLLVPTIRGVINVTASPGKLEVAVPCNSRATLCLPRSMRDGGVLTPASTRLLLDGAEVEAVARGGHVCVGHELGCAAGGAPRQLVGQPRS